ncbi:NAD(P)/FAD-dependent oxidoreductase [Hymenobacter sp. BT635]|uniref:NAD(P)/FAD-dependent oxidoreductase n=1 Tax=Hymenobacter nitidus TaxID=2880929 RepID=A0ABS8A7V8_9BACT|nr:NAD(P)/FAD-dependent oxidoreductase [Hymenobacter nitidus]MCB2376485.1 NAD(P)/FAD-dependent oxidoreductase [Hymenobacter nitidus]
MPPSPAVSIDAVVIGAGQAGLAAAYYLQQHGLRFVVLDERPAVGDVWATRYDSLRLFSPAWASGLPGFPWPGKPLRYPTKAEAADYLQRYAAHFNFPLQLGQRVVQVAPLAENQPGYSVRTAAGQHFEARLVLVCTGAFNAPRLPLFSPELSAGVVQLHSSAYRRPGQLPGSGPVAVVGSGNSALQIAADLATTGRPVYAAYNEQTPALPNNTAMWVFLKATGMLRVSRHTALGRRLLGRPEPVVSADLARLRTFANVQFIGKALGTEAGNSLRGQQVTTPALEAVVWATGYGPDFNWIQVPVFDAAGAPLHHRGLTSAPGLAFLGLPWLNTRASALMGGVGPDARYVVEALLKKT